MCVCVAGGRYVEKTGSVVLVAHKSGGAFTVFSPPPVIPRACKT